jgi:hypothetical protein
MDTQFVSDLMSQFNNDNNLSAHQGSNFVDADIVHTNVPNKVPFKFNAQNLPQIQGTQDVRVYASNGPASNGSASNGPASNGSAYNGPASVMKTIQRGQNVSRQPMEQPMVQSMVQPMVQPMRQQTGQPMGQPTGQPMGQLQTLNQIPKNLSNGIASTRALEGSMNCGGSKSANSNVDVSNSSCADSNGASNHCANASSDFYTIFGFQLSKTTVYIIIAFIAIIVMYYIYKYFTSSSQDDKDKRKRKPEVSYDEQVSATG